MHTWWRCSGAPEQPEICPSASSLPSSLWCWSGEAGCGFGTDMTHTHPAYILVLNWSLSKPAAINLTVVSLQNPTTIIEVGATRGSRKHIINDSKCSDCGWVCIPFAVDTCGCCGAEAQVFLSCLASCLAIQLGYSKS